MSSHRLLVVLVIVALLSSLPLSTMSRPKILLLGDSLTQLSWDGWGGKLAHVYQRRADVINRGMAGYNTDWFLKYLQQHERDVLVDNVVLVIIFFGANDASCKTLNPRHHVPIPTYQDNLKTMIQKCRTHYQDVPIIVMTPPPVQHEQRLSYQKERYGDKATGVLERSLELSGQYANAAQQVVAHDDSNNNTCLINLWKTMQLDSNWERFFYDGLHFSREGNEFVAQSILRKIEQEIPQLAVTPCPHTSQYANSASKCPSLPQSGPYHDEIDHTNPSKAFE